MSTKAGRTTKARKPTGRVTARRPLRISADHQRQQQYYAEKLADAANLQQRLVTLQHEMNLIQAEIQGIQTSADVFSAYILEHYGLDPNRGDRVALDGKITRAAEEPAP